MKKWYDSVNQKKSLDNTMPYVPLTRFTTASGGYCSKQKWEVKAERILQQSKN